MTRSLSIRVSEMERAAIERRASSLGMSTAAYVRQCLDLAPPRPAHRPRRTWQEQLANDGVESPPITTLDYADTGSDVTSGLR